MPFTTHQIELEVSADAAFELCAGVENWPAIFPPCLKASVIEQHAESQLIELTAKANGVPMTWQSRRELSRERRTIGFRQLQLSPLISRMAGTWRFLPLRQGTLVVLEHDYEVRSEIPAGVVAGVATPSQAEQFMARTVDDNSRSELAAIRSYFLETLAADKPWSRSFEDSHWVDAEPARVFSLLRDACDWPTLLQHCRSVDVHYDDGCNQELTMAVEVSGGLETIRTIRQCHAASGSITYFQPKPPAPLVKHTGEWCAEPLRGGTRLLSRHTLELNPELVRAHWGECDAPTALDRVEQAIGRNSAATMRAVAARTLKTQADPVTTEGEDR